MPPCLPLGGGYFVLLRLRLLLVVLPLVADSFGRALCLKGLVPTLVVLVGVAEGDRHEHAPPPGEHGGEEGLAIGAAGKGQWGDGFSGMNQGARNEHRYACKSRPFQTEGTIFADALKASFLFRSQSRDVSVVSVRSLP